MIITDSDLINSIFLAKEILDEKPQLLTKLEFDRQSLGNIDYNYQKQVMLHTAIIPLVSIIKSKIKQQNSLAHFNIQVKLVDGINAEDVDCRGLSGIMLNEGDGNYVILLDENESYCTQRLTLCKELFQIYIDEVGINTGSNSPHEQLVEATRELIHKFYNSKNIPQLTDRFDSSERFAKSVAIELMIPYPIRKDIGQKYKEGMDIQLIAQRLFITKETLEEYMKYHFDLTTPIYDII